MYAHKELIIQLQRIAAQYGARKEISSDVYEACVELVTEQFAGLGIEEIAVAYQLWAAKKIDGLEMYGGEFNATQLGRVLSAYKAWRAKLVSAYLQKLETQQREAGRKAKAEQLEKELYKNMPEKLRQAKANFESWQRVPYHWFKVCWKLGLIRLTEEQQAKYKAKAEQLAEQERSAEIHEVQSAGKIFKLAGIKRKDMKPRANVIAAKLAIWDVIQRQK